MNDANNMLHNSLLLDSFRTKALQYLILLEKLLLSFLVVGIQVKTKTTEDPKYVDVVICYT